MSQRLNAFALSPELFKKFVEFGMLLKSGTIEQSILGLVEIRASQINGCGFCLDMHIKQARIAGERELRLHHVAIWRESTLFSPRERAALAWTEALTSLDRKTDYGALRAELRSHFSDVEISILTTNIAMINLWNRIQVSAH